MNIELIFRIIGMIALAIVGVYWGDRLGSLANISRLASTIGLGLIGALVGFVCAPYVTTRAARTLRTSLSKFPAQTLFAGLLGLIVGLIVAALSALPLSLLPPPFGNLIPVIGAVIFSYFGIVIFVVRQTDIFTVFRSRFANRSPEQAEDAGKPVAGVDEGRTVLLDTSVIIDGRIADIAKTGFLTGTLLIPRFVLNELQYIADSSDNLRRQRGRRGMEVLAQLQKDNTIPVRISDIDVEGIREVDDKLVVLARQLRCPILTNDYNLNRIADLQGVKVLNVNELANAVKSVLLPGESLTVQVIQEGREADQGVAYLDDGTMVVVEDGRNYINKRVNVTVTKVLQTAAGRMIFARLDTNGR